MESCSRGVVLVECLVRELTLQHHLRALWEDEVIQEAGDAGRLVQSKLLQSSEVDPSAGRSGGWLRHVVETYLDEFEQRASFEEGCQIPNRNFRPCIKSEPGEGGEIEIAKVRVDIVQREARQLRKLTFENGAVESHIPISGIGVICDREVFQLWCWSRESCQNAFEVVKEGNHL